MSPRISLPTSDPLMTDLLRIQMTNPKPTATNRRRTDESDDELDDELDESDDELEEPEWVGERHPRRVCHSGSYAERDRQHANADNVLCLHRHTTLPCCEAHERQLV